MAESTGRHTRTHGVWVVRAELNFLRKMDSTSAESFPVYKVIFVCKISPCGGQLTGIAAMTGSAHASVSLLTE